MKHGWKISWYFQKYGKYWKYPIGPIRTLTSLPEPRGSVAGHWHNSQSSNAKLSINYPQSSTWAPRTITGDNNIGKIRPGKLTFLFTCIIATNQLTPALKQALYCTVYSCSTSAKTRDRKWFSMQLILVISKVDIINHICQMLSFCWKLLSAYFAKN